MSDTMSDTRKKNFNWKLSAKNSYPDSTLAVLMDIRDELQELNRTLACPNFTSIPTKLAAIQRNTAKPKPEPKRRATK